MIPEIWSMRQNFFHFGPFFALYSPPPPLTTQRIKIFKNWKKTPRDIIILHKCTINDNHIIYGSWDINWNRQIVILGHFCPFTHLTARKIKMSKNFKKPGYIIILHKCTKNHDHMLYCSWEFVCDRCNYVSFWAIFYPFTPLKAQKTETSQKWKNDRRYLHFTLVHQKSWS